jgi:hypothetical protein
LTPIRFWSLIAAMKHYFLVSVTIPEQTQYDKWQSWLAFLSHNTLHRKITAETQRLADNVWLIDQSTGAIFFSHLVSQADGYGLKPQVRFLTEDSTISGGKPDEAKQEI